MGSHPIDNKQIINADNQETSDSSLQKPNIYNKYSPFYKSIKKQASMLFDEIRENLSRTIQLGELDPGFSIWSKKLQQFISFYGFNFTKADHLKLINLYLAILSITDLNYVHVQTCFDMLYELLRKTRLITRDDLTIDWRIFYGWLQLIDNNHDETHSLVVLPKDIDITLFLCVRRCSPYFSAMATQEILDELRPQMCPIDSSFFDTMKMFDLFLPVNLPPDLHSQGFELWLNEFFAIWENIYNNTAWEVSLIGIFASVTWNNIGYINWEPWLSQIFTRILRGFSLPSGKIQMPSQRYTYIESYSTKWIVAMIGNRSSCLQYLQDLLIGIKSFYHPSNTGEFQENLVEFVTKLAEHFLDRVHLERKAHPVWFFAPVEAYRLTEQDIADFVNCVKEYAFISIFNKTYAEEATKACQYLSILRPELIVSSIVEKHFSSIDNMNEPHRFVSIMNCLTHIARQIVRQTSTYSQGQIYVLPLLMSVLPGIDLNDLEKTSVTFEFLVIIFMLITCVDCSSAINTRNDLTEIEKEVCLSTAKFEDFITEFLNRIFQMIDILSTDISDAVEINADVEIVDTTIKAKLTSILFNIVQQCSSKIFQKVREKMMNFVTGTCLSPKVRDIVSCLVRALIKGNPIETLKYLLPKTCESIERILNNSEPTVLLTDHKKDIELNWYLTLFIELVHARGDALLIYKKMILSIFHQCIHIINKNSYEAVADAAERLLETLTNVYPIDYRLTIENLDEPFIDFLPIRAWGQYVDIDKLQVQFHIPNDDEIDFASEFIDTFMYPELTLLNEKCFKMSNNERLRSLVIIRSIAVGCFRMIPRIESKEVQDLMPSVVSYDSKYQSRDIIHSKKLKLRENLRMRLLIDIGNLLDKLIENHSDDVASIAKAMRFYLLISTYYGVYYDGVHFGYKGFTTVERLMKNKLCGEGQNIRCLIIQKMAMQIKGLEMCDCGSMTDIDKEIILKLFELSINRYSEVRLKSQNVLFGVLNCYELSFHVIVDRIVELLETPGEVDHDQIKGCLYILLGDDSFFLPTKYSWTVKEKLWPSIARMPHTKKHSTQNLIANISYTISKRFVTELIIQNTNEMSMHAAAALWHPLQPSEMETREESNQANIQSYNNLMETFSSLLKGDTLTWGQQKITISLLCLLLQKHVPIPSSCVRTFVDFLVHDNIELRMCAEKGIAAFCRLQKPPRIYVEKPLEEILHNTGKPLPAVIYEEGHPGDRDDNLWVTINDYKPPETQIEWEQTCFLDKPFYGYYIWPKMIKYSINKRERYTQNNMPEKVAILYDRSMDKDFLTRATKLMILDEDDKINFSEIRFAMFKGLFRNFGLAFIDNFMEELYVLIHENIKEKQEGSHRVAAEIVAGIIRGSKYWTLEMLKKLWEKLTPFLTEVCNNLNSETLFYWNLCFEYCMENEDPRRMHRVIDFLRTLINTKTTSNTFNETAHWSLIRNLNEFKWRIPAILCEINEHAKTLIDHPSPGVRERIANFDIDLFNGKSTRQPNTNQFIDTICEQLQQAIEIYEKKSLINVLNNVIEIDLEARKALNFIETVVLMHSLFFVWCQQPVKNAIIRIFPYLCEIESIAGNDHVFRQDLTISRLFVGMCYLNAHFLEAFIQQLTQICRSPKWHVRRAAIEFAQNMIFNNLFNARPFAKRLHELVLKCLFDEQFEVRNAALITLSGFYQCGYIQITPEDLTHFCDMSKTKYYTKIDGKKVTLPKNIVRRHGGVLGLCAIVLSSPYDIPTYVPDALMHLCEYSHNPDIIQKSIKNCLSEFRRTHHDSWHEHQEQFTKDQLEVLADVLIPHSYYA